MLYHFLLSGYYLIDYYLLALCQQVNHTLAIGYLLLYAGCIGI